MRSASLTSGSIPDRLHAVDIQVKALRDAADAAYRSPRLGSCGASSPWRSGSHPCAVGAATYRAWTKPRRG
jgi:hypothetical protein